LVPSEEQERTFERADPSGGVEKQLEQALSEGLELEELEILEYDTSGGYSQHVTSASRLGERDGQRETYS
jgi:hypothetical protein